jgi:hypothetical protein
MGNGSVGPKHAGRVMDEWVIDCGCEEVLALCGPGEEPETSV